MEGPLGGMRYGIRREGRAAAFAAWPCPSLWAAFCRWLFCLWPCGVPLDPFKAWGVPHGMMMRSTGSEGMAAAFAAWPCSPPRAVPGALPLGLCFFFSRPRRRRRTPAPPERVGRRGDPRPDPPGRRASSSSSSSASARGRGRGRAPRSAPRSAAGGGHAPPWSFFLSLELPSPCCSRCPETRSATSFPWKLGGMRWS